MEKQVITGIKALINYIDTKDEKYVPLILDNVSSIKFWAIFTMFMTNNDDIFDSISPHLLEKIFTLKKIKRPESYLKIEDESYYDYGFGYKSNINNNYLIQLKIIRNSFAHNKFMFDKDIITIENQNFKAVFDIKWLEALILVCLAHKLSGIEKNLSVTQIVSIREIIKDENIFDIVQNKKVLFIKLTLLNDNLEVLNKIFNQFKHITEEEKNFEFLRDMVFLEIKFNMLNKDLSIPFEMALAHELKKINKKYDKIMKVEIDSINLKKYPFINNEEFLNLSLIEQLQSIIDYFACFEKSRYNTISLKQILNFLYCLENNINPGKLFEFSFHNSRDFLIKIYALIAFINRPKEAFLKVLEDNEANITYGYKHAKNVYLEILKVIKRSLESIKDYPLCENDLARLKKIKRRVENNLTMVLDNNPKKIITHKIRNALVHNHIEYENDLIILYDLEKNYKLPFYTKKTQEKEYREFSFKSKVFEIKMSKKDFESLIDDLFISLELLKPEIDKRIIRSNNNLTKRNNK